MPADARYYLYRSVSKIDMLYEQIGPAPRSKRTTFGIDLKVVKGGTESTSAEEVRLEDKLRAVEEDLESRHLVGTPDQPKDYFKGILPMRWGLYDDLGIRPEGDPALVFFGGIIKDLPLIVGLGGSSIHVTGHKGATNTYSRSATPELVRWMMAGLKDDSRPPHPEEDGSDALKAVCIALNYLKPPTQELEVFAKTLIDGRLLGEEHFTGTVNPTVILGTPLYVAQAHREPEHFSFGLDSEW
jgi:hypothetical protein